MDFKLKPFQQATVRKILDGYKQNSSGGKLAFLDSDEVGLGKTIVARGVITALAYENVLAGKTRLNVIYFCSNLNIAKQNTGKLDITGNAPKDPADRLTMLLKGSNGGEIKFTNLENMYSSVVGKEVPESLPDDGKCANGKCRINIYSLTPKTSIEMKGAGKEEERAYLLYNALADIGKLQTDKYTEAQKIVLSQKYKDLEKDIEEAKKSTVQPNDETKLWERIRNLAGELILEQLEPDIVIYDEFQNFKEIFDSKSENKIMEKLLNSDTKQLMLSATPFRMYYGTGMGDSDDAKSGDIKTICGILHDGLPSLLTNYKIQLERFAESTDTVVPQQLLQSKQQFENEMKKYFTRVERRAVIRAYEKLSGTATLHSTEKDELICNNKEDILEFARYADEFTDRFGFNAVKFQTDAPYFISFMHGGESDSGDGYQLKRNIGEQLKNDPNDLDHCLLKRSELESYSPLGLWHGVYRMVLNRILGLPDDDRSNDPGAARLVWIPCTAVPYDNYDTNDEDTNDECGRMYRRYSEEQFGKSLIFSQWVLTPRMLSVLITHEIKRRLLVSINKKDPRSVMERAERAAAIIDKMLDRTNELQDISTPFNEIKTLIKDALKNCSADSAQHDMQELTKKAVKSLFLNKATGYHGLLAVWSLYRDSDDPAENMRKISAYCKNGRLQQVLEELIYVQDDKSHPYKILMDEFGRNRAANLRISVSDNGAYREDFTVSSGFARCIGCSKDDDRISSIENLRQSFNSPFIPFVFATTSVGQEGLDFHKYANHIVHWNLPYNPVDFEQREGRIDRYNSLMIRQALLKHYHAAGASVTNILDRSFDRARMFTESAIASSAYSETDKERLKTMVHSGLIPNWILPLPDGGTAAIKRSVPYFLASEMMNKYHNIQTLVQLYRAVIGHSNPDELLDRLLIKKPDGSDAIRLCDSISLDFTPFE